jgi:hypothetical protein
VQELVAGTDADVARLAAAAIQLARASEQHRPLVAVQDLSTSPRRIPPRRHQPVGRTGGQSARFDDPRRRSQSNEAVRAAEG